MAVAGGRRARWRRRRARRSRAASTAAATPTTPAAAAAGCRSPSTATHQAGIVTAGAGPPALRRVRRAPPTTRDELVAAAAALDRRRRADDRRASRPARSGRPSRALRRAAGRHRRGASGSPPAGPHAHLRLRPVAVRDADGTDRFGLADRRPAALDRPAALPGRRPRPGAQRRRPLRAGLRRRPAGRGARGPQPRPHRLRHGRRALVAARLRPHVVAPRRRRSPPRNLFGFKDGTANLKAEETADARRARLGHGRTTARDAWLTGGTYLVARRISMHIETWDRTSLREQEKIIGRTKAEGAPLSGGERVHRSPTSTLQGTRRHAADRPDCARARSRTPSTTAASGCCAAATTSSTAATASGASTPGCSSSPSSRDPRTHFVPMQTAAREAGSPVRVPAAHRLRPLRRSARRAPRRVRRRRTPRLMAPPKASLHGDRASDARVTARHVSPSSWLSHVGPHPDDGSSAVCRTPGLCSKRQES